MITSRERELLAWIDENPMISQQELAQLAGITRSSVAVHISNLMKKGYIQGKGYVLKKAPYAAVVGGANLDITAFADGSLALEDSNPGRVQVGFGGVGHNQARGLRLLGVDVKFIGAFGEDMYGEKMRQHCRDLAIDIKDSITVPLAATSTYVSLVDGAGKLQAGVSDMAVYEHLTPAVLQGRLAMVNKAEVCAADTNLPAESLAFLAQNAEAPLFVETISRAKVSRAGPVLDRVHTLKTDRDEAARLLDFAIDGEEDARRAVNLLLERGVQNVYMHLPAENQVVCAHGKTYFKLAYHAPEVSSKNGARDSFMAALVWAHMEGLGLAEAARAGVAAASLATADALTADYLRRAIS